jgi:hypothetical protein
MKGLGGCAYSFCALWYIHIDILSENNDSLALLVPLHAALDMACRLICGRQPDCNTTIATDVHLVVERHLYVMQRSSMRGISFTLLVLPIRCRLAGQGDCHLPL